MIKTLLIGWDAADWKVISPLIDVGETPNLKYLIENGVMGNLATLYPVLSPMLWTIIAHKEGSDRHKIAFWTRVGNPFAADRWRLRPSPLTSAARMLQDRLNRGGSSSLQRCGIASSALGL
jgi:hypothetical protein